VPVITCVVDAGNASHSIDGQGGGARRLGSKAANGLELGDFHAHSLDDAPATEGRAETHGDMTQQQHPERNVIRAAQHACGREDTKDDAGSLLRVIATMPQAVERSAEELPAAKQGINVPGCRAANAPRQ
jgi:hypothetical protein